MAQYSAALNESSYLSGKPDPRTGMFSKNLSFGKLSGNYRNGPHFSLQLAFDPQTSSSSLTSYGFGAGWSLSLPSYAVDPNSRPTNKGHLSLLSGSTYYIEPIDGVISLEGYLVKNMSVTCSMNPLSFQVVHKSGAQEIYNVVSGDSSGNAVLSQIIDKSGRSLYLNYQAIGSNIQLKTITDDTGDILLTISTDTQNTSVTLYPGTTEEADFELVFQGSELTKFYGPEGYEADFTYEPLYNQLLITEVSDNQGLLETANYDDKMTLPGGQQQQATIHYYSRTSDPKNPNSDYLATYQFNSDDNNYLGYPAISTADVNALVDSLLHYSGKFSYTTTFTENIGGNSSDVKTTTSTYNKFHSITQQIITYGSGGCSVTENFEYDGMVDDSDITGQKPTYKLPTAATSTWSDGTASFDERFEFSWDDSGNITRVTKDTGVITQFDYYPAEGDDGCPADPNGFVAHIKRKTVIPANVDDASLPIAPTRETVYNYEQLPVYSGGSDEGAQYFVVRTQETSSEGPVDGDQTTAASRRYTYINEDTTDLLAHGRLSQVASDIYHLENGSPIAVTTLHDFAHSLAESDDGKSSLIHVAIAETGYDGTARETAFDQMQFQGRIVRIANTTTSSSSPVTTVDFTYDGLGRMTSKVACKDSPEFQAGQTYMYSAANVDPDKPYICKTTINANGVGKRTYYDGSKHTLFEETQDADGVVSDDTSAYYETSRTVYNALGQKLSQTATDRHSSWSDPITSTTVYGYDDWGNQSVITYTNGYQEISQDDPLTQTTYSAVVIDGTKEQIQIVAHDRFGNPLTTTRQNKDGSPYSNESCEYDGLGRALKDIDALTAVTLTEYDSFDRPSLVTLADGTQIIPTYADHSADDLTTTLTVYASSSDGADQYTFGTRLFDGLDRVTQTVIGGRTTVFEYAADDDAQSPAAITLPVGTTLSYTYQPELSYAMLSVDSSDGDEPSLTYDYFPTNAQQKSAVQEASSDGDTSSWSYEYFLSGQTKTEKLDYLVNGESATRSASFVYSLCGLLVSYTDVLGQSHGQTYNAYGQTETSSIDGVVSSKYTYDGAGRPSQTVTTNSNGSEQSTVLTFDEHGREATRTLTVTSPSGASSEQDLELEYSVVDGITQKAWKRDGQTLRTENYTYTAVGQLETYQCSGTEYPDSPDGYRLTGQQFEFDFIGNITKVTSNLLDTTNKAITNVATYSYTAADRTQLIGISNDKITAWNVTLTYDANGNLTQDEQGRHLSYNSQNQLTALNDASQTLLGNYWYDALGILLAEKSADDSAATTLYYQAGQLVNELQGTTASTYLNADARLIDDAGTTTVQLLGADQQGSIVQINSGEDVSYRTYDEPVRNFVCEAV